MWQDGAILGYYLDGNVRNHEIHDCDYSDYLMKCARLKWTSRHKRRAKSCRALYIDHDIQLLNLRANFAE